MRAGGQLVRLAVLAADDVVHPPGQDVHEDGVELDFGRGPGEIIWVALCKEPRKVGLGLGRLGGSGALDDRRRVPLPHIHGTQSLQYTNSRVNSTYLLHWRTGTWAPAVAARGMLSPEECLRRGADAGDSAAFFTKAWRRSKLKRPPLFASPKASSPK